MEIYYKPIHLIWENMEKKINAPYIMNLYLKSSKGNRYTGLCSSSNNIIKSNDFSKEYINTDNNFKPKECTGLIRDEIVKRCHKFKAGFLRFGCIVDICSNIPIEIEKQAEKEKAKMRNVNLITPGVEIDRRRIDASTLNPGNSNMCISWGDPHFTTFQGTKFNNYFLGDHLLLKSKKFTIQVRQRRWGGASVNTDFAAKINGVIVEASRPDYFLLNRNERINIKVGQVIGLQRGGKIERIEKDRWLLISHKYGYADISFNYYGGKLRVNNQIFQRRYMNFIIKVPHPDKSKGFCAGQIVKSFKNLFSTYYVKEDGVQSKVLRKCRGARLRCANSHVNKSDFKNCINDLCNGFFEGKVIRNFEKRAKHDRRRWEQIFKSKTKRSTKEHFQRFSENRKHHSEKRKKMKVLFLIVE